MITVNGTCQYCGQMRILQVSEDKNYSQEDLDRIAASECDCDVAIIFRKRNMAFGNLEGMLDESFPDDAIDDKARNIKELLRASGKLMSETIIDSIAFSSGSEKYSLTLSQKLTFKLKITNTETEVKEA